MKKIGAAAATAAMTIVAAALCGVALADGGHAGAKPGKPAAPQAANHDQKAGEPAAKVYICHATGSTDSNPYVLIHVSSHALPAHTRHQDGRDIVLGASPGTCPGASATTNVKGAEHSESSAAGVQSESASKQQDQQKPSEPEAKVYICHATGSASNPYVLIHVSSHALPAHTRHQDGRDIVLGASPGTCPGASTAANSEAAGVQGVEATTSCTNDDEDQAKSDETAKQHDDNGRGDDKNGEDRDNCPAAASTSNTSRASNLSAVSASNASSASNTSASTSSNTASASNTAATSSNTTSTPSSASTAQSAGVLGTTKALTAPAAPVLSAKPSAGVLGAVAKISSAATSGTLPFSGIRLWIVELVALGLIGLGVATRMLVRRRPN